MMSMIDDLRARGAGRMKEMGLIAATTAVVLALVFPHQLGVLLTKINLLALSAVGGYWIDRTAFRADRRPHLLLGPERSYAEGRRAAIIAAAMLSMALAL
jgi:hypothetical protein